MGKTDVSYPSNETVTSVPRSPVVVVIVVSPRATR